ncbi:TPA: PA2169 family four-helix-bundle protein [Pseudomonas aeruginosa]|uniref:PA2169 family four-helix-bundle protein n=1 Tax=Pseudomonas aeruginosa TaxID=287 RepID=UPI000707C2F3|nr:PA2169 family four-helix-bundle protein [Pseudomonas aeruginosa]KQJ63546.1 aldehyde dehydrogenase [Pseudomonas aeruginosa]RTV44481.1 PA2169 family four-helix-bundle protein [Pseudomonas aeruginosa]
MNQTNLDETLDVLNDLLQTSKDGEAGFHACAEDLRDPQLKAAMLEQSRDCAAAADELERIVLELGGKPKDSTSFAGDLHRRWVDLKSLVTGKDEEAVLNECERGEDVAKHRYQAALEKSLPAEIHQVIERQYQGVLRHHDRVRALRDARA